MIFSDNFFAFCCGFFDGEKGLLEDVFAVDHYPCLVFAAPFADAFDAELVIGAQPAVETVLLMGAVA